MTHYLRGAALLWLSLCFGFDVSHTRTTMNQTVVNNDMPLIKGYSDFSMKQLDGFQGISLELNFLDGELNFEVTRDNYALIEDDVIKVSTRGSAHSCQIRYISSELR